MKPCSKTPLSFPETIQQYVFFMHVLVFILKADLWSTLRTAIVAQFTGSTAILRVTMT